MSCLENVENYIWPKTFAVGPCFNTHIASDVLEDSFEIWIDVTLRNLLLCVGEKKRRTHWLLKLQGN